MRAVNSENGTSGLGSAVRGLVDGQDGPAAPDTEQLALLPESGGPQAPIPEGEGQAAERRGPGRPPGARNKRTEEWTDYILSKHRSPLLFLAEAYSLTLEELRERLKCEPLEAFKIQIQAAKELAPYVHQKQPMAMQVDGKGRVLLVATGLPGAPGASVDALTALGLSVDDNGSVVLDGEAIDRGDDDEADDDEGNDEVGGVA